MIHRAATQYDVIVIGAGPGGSDMAYYLAQKGISVLVLDKDNLVREKPCGGGIQLKEIMDFGFPPDEVIERKINAVRIITAADKEVDARLTQKAKCGIIVKRSIFDHYLQNRAEIAGALIIPNSKVFAISRDKSGFIVRTSPNNATYRAKLVINAGGAAALNINKMLGIPHIPREICATYHWWVSIDEIPERLHDTIELYYSNVNPHGYIWIFPMKHLLSVGIGATTESIRNHRINLKNLLYQFKNYHTIASDILKNSTIEREFGGIIPLHMPERLYSSGAIAIGDAAFLANLIHGGGIYQARKSAQLAARHCLRYLKTGSIHELQKYDSDIRSYLFNYESKWDSKIRRVLWEGNVLDKLVDRGKNDKQITTALGTLISSAKSHAAAYKMLERKMLDILYSELEEKALLYRVLVDKELNSIFTGSNEQHRYANEMLLNSKAKRLRASLCVLASDLFNGNTESAVKFSIIYEIFHTASLIHDDIMDGSLKRRGRKTLHAKYGINSAIITGDLLLLKGYTLVGSFSQVSNLARERILDILLTIGNEGEKCCIGQNMDLRMAREKKYNNIHDYLTMISLKTGSLIEGAVKAGAIIADASSEQIHAISRFGLNMGIAFQIIDDSLDLLGGRNANKTIMNDLKQGKVTPMIIHVLKNAEPQEKDLILRAAGNKNLSSPAAKKVVDLYDKYGAIEYAQKLSHSFINKAREELMTLPVAPARKHFEEILDVMDYWSLLAD